MFLKAIAAFITSHLLFLGISAPKKTPPLPRTPASTQALTIATTSKEEIVVEQAKSLKTGQKPQEATSTTKVQTKTKTAQPKLTVPTQKQAAPAPKPQASAQVSTSSVQAPPEQAPDFEKINTDTRKAIVNIFCVTTNSSLSSISGTGVIVSTDGLILTNAHVAQYLLLKDFGGQGFVNCIARTGSPASPTYNLELVYISPAWVEKNKTILKQQNPLGTGEDDYAFLRITGRVDGTPQTSFPFVPMDIRESIEIGEPVLLASYPAGFLGGMSIVRDLNLTSAIANIATLYTFTSNTIDVISVPGTVVSQKGSSGGAVVDKRTHLLGLISTSSDGKTTGERDLQAITSAYINRDLKSTLGVSLAQFIYSNHSDFASTFASTTAPRLSKLIEDELSK